MAVPGIPCIFNRGCSAAKFLFVPQAHVDIYTQPLPAVEGRGGSRGGGTILACLPPLTKFKHRRKEAFMSIFGENKAVAELSFRLGELAGELANLKSAHKHLELEWEELYDKVRHQMARMSRRAKADAVEPLNDEETEIPAGDETTIDPISARILRRRNAGGFAR